MQKLFKAKLYLRVPNKEQRLYTALMLLMPCYLSTLSSLFYNPLKGSKRIRQWPINWCTYPMMINKQNYPFCRLKLVVETFGQSKF